MEIKEMMEFLSKIELFKGLNDEELQIVANNIEIKEYKEKEYIFKENNERERIFIIRDGSHAACVRPTTI